MADAVSESRFIAAADGLKIHVKDCGERTGRGLPVVCLAGLSRTVEDFEVLTAALVAGPHAPRRVVAIDSRGRGLSGFDPEPEHYSIPVELRDVVTVMTALGIAPAVIAGTSRGGLITMELAAQHPHMIAGVVFNDIGPVVELGGLMRIKSYVGRMPQPADFHDGAAMLERHSGGQFPRLGATDWLAAARRAWRAENGRLVPTYDVAIARGLDEIGPDTAMPDMWKQFDALADVPVLVIRGARSDLLSATTVAAMSARHPGLEAIEVPDQGHAPLLSDPQTIGTIAAFMARCDAAFAGRRETS